MAAIISASVHFLAWFWTPGALGSCPSNHYYDYSYEVCHPCADNTSNPDGAGNCVACPMGKFTPLEAGDRRRRCALSGCGTRRRRSRRRSYGSSPRRRCPYTYCSSISPLRTGCDPIACPVGQKLRDVLGRCLPSLAYMLEYGPTPTFVVRADNYSFVWLGLHVPLPAEVYEKINLTVSVDIAPNISALAPDSNCSSQWTWTRIASGYNVTKAFTYPELNGPCTLGVAFNSSTGTRSGAVGVFLSRNASSANQVGSFGKS